MQRNDLTRILAILTASAALPTATAAPPSASVGQIELQRPPGEPSPPLSAPTRPADLARTMQISPSGHAASDDGSALNSDTTTSAAETSPCFLGSQIAALAAALPLEDAGLSDVCVALVWLDSEARRAQANSGVRSLQGSESATGTVEAPPSATDPTLQETGSPDLQSDPSIP